MSSLQTEDGGEEALLVTRSGISGR